MKLTSKGRYAVMALTDLAIYDRMGTVSLRDVSVRQINIDKSAVPPRGVLLQRHFSSP